MKSLLLASIMASGVYASEKPEYIVKLKNTKSIPKTLTNLGQVKSLGLSFGNFVTLTTDQKNLKSVMLDPAVEYIEPNYTYTRMNQPQDAQFTKQWGLENTGKNSGSIFSPGVAGIDISALKAWKITRGDSSIKIAVIDTGVDYNHSDLKKNIMVNTLELNGTEGVDDDGNGYIDDIYGYNFFDDHGDPMDGNGHGTHCAGVIGAEHNSIGIAGVMADVQMLAVKFLSDNGSGRLSDALKAIDYSTQRGVDIMSNSWGGGGRSQALFEAIQSAQDKGILFIAAAGNSNSDNDTTDSYPANYQLDNVISVGALDPKGKKASFSSYGKNSVHVFAPGVKIYSTIHSNQYSKMSGTSMATPHVSGVVGLIKAHEPNLTMSEIKERLLATTIKSTQLSPYTATGYVDAHHAVTGNTQL